MPTFNVRSAKHDQKSSHNLADGSELSADESLTAIAERLTLLRTTPSDVLAHAVIEAGSCLDEMPDGTRPGWLFDQTTDRDTAAHVCAGCPVRATCLELELRLFGADRHGMWGPLGEDGRRALHPVWVQAREDAADDASRGERR